MFRIVEIPDAVCEACGRKVSVVCFWFEGPKADKERESLFSKRDEMTAERKYFGEHIDIDFALDGKESGGRWLGYVRHGDPKDPLSRHYCKMSRKAPKDEGVLRRIIAEVQKEESNSFYKKSAAEKAKAKKFRRSAEKNVQTGEASLSQEKRPFNWSDCPRYADFWQIASERMKKLLEKLQKRFS